jgi:hypothetical protein
LAQRLLLNPKPTTCRQSTLCVAKNAHVSIEAH